MLKVSLDSLWWGVSAGGRHYTGHLYFSDHRERVELERELTLSEAKDLWAEQRSPEDTERYWNYGLARKTNRFDTSADLERAAVKWCEANIKGDWILKDDRRVLGTNCVNPVRVRMLNLIAEKWNKAYVWRAGFGHIDRDLDDTFYRAYEAWDVKESS
jgi:hypothetical protein